MNSNVIKAIGTDSVAWYRDEVIDVFDSATEIITAPVIAKTYKMKLRYELPDCPTTNEIEQLALIASYGDLELEKFMKQGDVSNLVLPVQSESYAIWMHPLIRENSFLYLKDTDLWEDFDGTEIASQPHLIESIHTLKIRPLSLSYRSFTDTFHNRIHEFMARVEILDQISIEKMAECIKTQRLFVEPSNICGEVTRASYKNLLISDNCIQDYFDWCISTTIDHRDVLLLESTNPYGLETVSIVNTFKFN
jgi:hypothetical protein